MSVPRKEGKGLREGSDVAKTLGHRAHQGKGMHGTTPPELAVSMGKRMGQGTGMVRNITEVKDLAQRLRQGSIK